MPFLDNYFLIKSLFVMGFIEKPFTVVSFDKITVDPGNSISLEDFQATFIDVPIASSSLSESVIVSSELSYTPIHKRQRNEDSFYAGPVKTYPLRQKKQLGVHYKLILYYFRYNKLMLSRAVVFIEF